MINKRGQVTIFIIFGVVLLVLSIAYFSYYYKSINGEETLMDLADFEADISGITQYLASCNEQVAVKAAYALAEYGGHYPLDNPKMFDPYTITYSYDESQNPPDSVLPSVEQLEENLGDYVAYALPICVQEFGSFEEMGLDITSGNVESTVDVQQEKVIIKTSYYLEVMEGDQIQEIYELPPVQVNVRLGLLHEMSGNIVSWIKENPSLIPDSKIDSMLEPYNQEITAFIPTSDADMQQLGNTLMIVLRDKKSNVFSGSVVTEPSDENINFDYVFGAKFT